MNILNKFRLAAIAAAVGLVAMGAVSTASAAVYITGDVAISGNILDSDLTGVRFDPSPAANYTVNNASGDMSDLVGQLASMSDIEIIGGAVTPGVVWSAEDTNGVIFSLALVATNSLIELSSGIELVATAILSAVGGGFSDTTGIFTITTNGGAGSAANFSSTTTVPLPASLLLLGSGVVGFGFVARRRRSMGEAA